MSGKTSTLSLAGLLCLSSSLMALPTPYGSPGTVNLVTYTFIASGTGPVTAYFVGSSAGYGSVIGLSVNGSAATSYGLQDNSTAVGTSFNMGSVTAGDTLRFILAVNTVNSLGPFDPVGGSDVSYYLNSDASLNPSGENHIYSYAYGGDLTIPAGTYVGFEDISPLANADLDYDDLQFVFTGVRGVPSVPEGGMTLTLLGMAVASLGLFRWKLRGSRSA